MVIPTHIVMPVRDQSHLTAAICDQLRGEEFERLWVFDNGSVDNTHDLLYDLAVTDRRILPLDAAGMGIYQMWDWGVTLARQAAGVVNIAIINNDITIMPGTMEALSGALRSDPAFWVSYPNYDLSCADGYTQAGLRVTTGTYRHGGMCGYCFMVAGERIEWTPLVHPIFRWWGGDDDIAFNIEAHGGLQVRVEGLPVDHDMESTARHHDLGMQKAEDLANVIAIWGR